MYYMKSTEKLAKKKTKKKKTVVPLEKNYWLGGIENAKQDWHHPDNWSNKCLPNESTRVVIPHSNTLKAIFPIISGNADMIASIELLSGAQLIIKKGGTLIIKGSKSLKSSIRNDGSFCNHGLLKVKKSKHEWLEMIDGYFLNEGLLLLDKPKLSHIANNHSCFINKGTIDKYNN